MNVGQKWVMITIWGIKNVKIFYVQSLNTKMLPQVH